jgi:hypothetical protein
MDIAAAARAVVDRLTAAGIRATLDERDLNPPAVYVGPPAVAWRFHAHDFDATFTAWCAVPNSGRDIALANLGPLITATLSAVARPVLSAEPADLTVPEQSAPLPAYRITWTEHVTHHEGETP